jgi:hypothetical protein
MQINVAVTDANNIVCTVVPPQVQTITIDRGVAGNGIVSIVPVTISTFQYLRITYTNGTVSDVGPLTSTAYTATAPINIIGNTISLLTVPIAVGGTGAVTAAAAIQNLLPSYTANGNKRLGLNSGATALEWVADGGGTVTSVAVSGGSTGLTTSGGPITGSGTITLAGTLAIANGGSGQTTAQAAMNAFAGAVTSGSYLRGDGTNVVMSGIQAGDVPTLNQNTTGTAANITATTNSTLTTLSFLSLPGSQVTGNISGNAANVTGIVAIANGGTGQTTANAALNALLPVQTGNATKYLQTNGTNASWDAISLSTADITGVLPTANGGTGLSAFTANQVFYASSTSAIAQSSNLQFNGTMLTAGSITNLALTPGRVTYTGSGNILTDSANLTFNGTNLSLAAGIANRVAYLNASKVLTTDDSFSIVNGQVGIGTVTPNNTLQVSGVLGAGITIGSGVNGTSGQLIIDSGTDGSSSSSIFGRGNGLNEWFVGSLRAFTGSGALGMVDYVYGSNPRVFYTNGTERMRILGSGNVGIGTNAPTQLLDVNGNLAITGSARRITGDFSNATVANRVAFQTSTANTITAVAIIPNGTANSSQLNLETDSAQANGTSFQFLAGVGGTEGRLQLGIRGTGTYLPMTFFTGGSERLRIDTSGNVGIGTSSPASIGGTLSTVANGNNGTGYFRNLATSGITSDQLQVSVSQSTNLTNFYLSRFYSNVISSPTVMHHIRGDGEGYFAGNVGIGTATTTNGNLTVQQASATTGGPILSLWNSNATAGNTCGYLRFFSNASARAQIHSVVDSAGPFHGNLIFSTGENTLSERMRVSSSGNVDIGSQVDAGNTLRYLDLFNTNTGAGAGSIIRLVTSNAAASGNTTVDIVKYKNGTFSINNNETNAAACTTFNVGASERMRIDSSGNLLVGTTSSEGPSRISSVSTASGTACVSYRNTAGAGSTLAVFINAANNAIIGSISNNSNTGVLYNVTSDYRLKTVIGPVADAGQRIDALQPVEYTWNSDGLRTRGFLAHQFQEVYASSVTGAKDAVDVEGKPVYQAMQASSSEVIADLVAEIKSLRARVAALESN